MFSDLFFKVLKASVFGRLRHFCHRLFYPPYPLPVPYFRTFPQGEGLLKGTANPRG